MTPDYHFKQLSGLNIHFLSIQLLLLNCREESCLLMTQQQTFLAGSEVAVAQT